MEEVYIKEKKGDDLQLFWVLSRSMKTDKLSRWISRGVPQCFPRRRAVGLKP